LEKIIIVIYLFLISCTNSASKSNKIEDVSDSVPIQVSGSNPEPAVCNTNFDTTLLRLAKSFQPSSSDVTHSMSDELNLFMLHVDTTCLRKQEMYSFFINAILAKVVLYQLKCCNQHYEMRHEKDGAKVIVNEFEKMAGFRNKQVEFLSSNEVESYIYKTPDLNSNPYLKSIMTKIKKEESRIASGNI